MELPNRPREAARAVQARREDALSGPVDGFEQPLHDHRQRIVPVREDEKDGLRLAEDLKSRERLVGERRTNVPRCALASS